MTREKSVLTQLREIVPLRTLSVAEGKRVAEQQANRLLKLGGISAPPTPNQLVTELPRFRVQLTELTLSGGTAWVEGVWRIVLNEAEPHVRQRFSLFHEFKHALDHPFMDFLYPTSELRTREGVAEQICDHFAACVLMPKAWVTSAYFNHGVHDLRTLARRFGVSQTAMNVRLQVLGLIDPPSRCHTYFRDGLTVVLDSPANAGPPGNPRKRSAA